LASFDFGVVLGLSVPGSGALPGFLGLFRDEAVLWRDQEVVALQTAAAALSNTLAREDLFEQVQATLSETEALYRGSAALSEASTYDGILDVLLAHSVLGRNAQTATMQLFNSLWFGEQRPEYSELVAYRGRKPDVALRRRYRVDRYPATLQMMQDGSILFVEDLDRDTSLDRRAHALFRRIMGARSVVVVPLVVGGQRIGFLHAGYAEPQVFSEAERRRLTSLAQQAAIAVLNIRQLRATEARVRREQLIRRITGRIQEAPDVDSVLQTAVMELGQALGTSQNRILFQPREADRSDLGMAIGSDGVPTGNGNGHVENDEPTNGSLSDRDEG
jgi:GAF domain-containing protein